MTGYGELIAPGAAGRFDYALAWVKNDPTTSGITEASTKIIKAQYTYRTMYGDTFMVASLTRL